MEEAAESAMKKRRRETESEESEQTQKAIKVSASDYRSRKDKET